MFKWIDTLFYIYFDLWGTIFFAEICLLPSYELGRFLEQIFIQQHAKNVF